MIVGVPQETFPGERRVALVPASCAALKKKHEAQILIESGAGAEAGYPDDAYTAAGASVVSRADVFAKADVVA
ncbi:MAG: NAD(P)(+) transhydrogenase (Re/Si-specific) subunit alpha, partial [Gemmatimonadetes bacterium]|nr:NAD(P)(+) transhydrogenase (Re/Si-specific) subunit alpha [Gemmatimonadota bacterium]